MKLTTMIYGISTHFPARFSEWLLSCILISWGASLLFMDPAKYELAVFTGLSQIASQAMWAVYAILVGMVRIAALIINGAYARSPWLRLIGAFIAVPVWANMTLGIMAEQVISTATGVYPWLMFADIYNVYRAAQDARISDRIINMGVLEDAQRT